MKKIALIAAIASVCSASVYANDYSQPTQSFSVGYARSALDVEKGSADNHANGINLKYNHAIDDRVGIITSFTYTDLDKKAGNDKLDFDYWSLMAGPSVTLGDRFNVYGMLGLARGKAELKTQLLSYKESHTDLAVGFGAQFYVTDQFLLDAHYEYSELTNEVDVGTWSIGAGYRF